MSVFAFFSSFYEGRSDACGVLADWLILSPAQKNPCFIFSSSLLITSDEMPTTFLSLWLWCACESMIEGEVSEGVVPKNYVQL